MLAEVDEAHETLSETATQKILYRAFHEFGECAYARLAQLSVAHLYNLRKTGTYRKRRVVYQGTRPTAVSIGERRKPDPQGGPGISTALFRPAAPLLIGSLAGIPSCTGAASAPSPPPASARIRCRSFCLLAGPVEQGSCPPLGTAPQSLALSFSYGVA